VNELYRQSGRRRLAKLVPTFADRGVSRGQRNGSPRPLNICFLDLEELLIFIQVAPQLTSRDSRGWVDPVPDPLLLRKSGSTGNRNRDLCICSQTLWPLDHRGELNRILTHNSFPHDTTTPRVPRPLHYRTSRSHSDTPHSVGLLWTSDQPDTQASTYQHTTFTTEPSAGFESTNPASERPQSQSLDRLATGIGRWS
jgi:hypothetical protein